MSVGERIWGPGEQQILPHPRILLSFAGFLPLFALGKFISYI
jgi:hypothetical protein